MGKPWEGGKSRNPFFIRSISPTSAKESNTPINEGRNPFFIRSISPTVIQPKITKQVRTKSQSLLHQVTLSNEMGMQVTKLGTMKSQSLLHQVNLSNCGPPFCPNMLVWKQAFRKPPSI